MTNKKPPNFLNQTKNPSDQKQIPTGPYAFGSHTPAGVFSDEVHDNLIRSKGFRSIHWRHALNPNRESIEGGIDLNDKSDVGAMNMYDPREFYVAMQQIGWQDQYVIQGIHGSSSIMAVNYTTYYENDDKSKERVFLRKHDIVSINSGHTVLVGQLFEYKPNGPQRVKFPIHEVDYLADGQKTRFEQGVDFVVNEGMLEWIGNKRPHWDPQKGRGAILSMNYWATPMFSVLETPRVMREVFSNPTGNAGQRSQGTYISGSAILKALWLDDSFQPDLPDWPRIKEPNRTDTTRS